MKLQSVFFTLFIFSSSLFSQRIDNKLLNDLKPRNIGPGGMSGRVTAIAVEPNEPSVFYVGTASGGIWKTTNGGINFNPVFDKEEVVGIGSIAIDPGNPDVVWVGTGEGNPRNSITGGYGLYKSLDAGRSWQLIGLEKTRHIHRIIVHPGNSDIIYVGAIGSPWGPHNERGVYKTTNGGETWEQILFVNEYTGVADMIMDPRNPEKLYVAMWEHLRQPWFFKSGGVGSGLHLTVDGGKNWKKLTERDGLPKGELGRIGLAVSKSNPDYVYALIESKKNAIYRSVDGGYNWVKRGDENIGDRPFYYADIYVDPSNENRVYSLYSNVNISEDGAKTFRTLLGRNIHSDHHAWWIHPEDPTFMIDGNDGGLAITRDKGKNWRHVTNLPVSQFYHISVDNELPYNVYGGMQDNGSWKGPAYVWSRDGIINEYWDFLIGGDGFDVKSVPGDANICYAMSQGGNLARINTLTGKSTNIMPAEEDVKLRWNWNSALAQDPFDRNTIYYGSQFVHKSSDRGDSWKRISPDLTTNDSSRQKYNKSGGLTYDVTGAETYTCILTIAPSPLKEGIIWVGTDDGNIQLTKDSGKTWTNFSPGIKDFPERPWIPQIVASPINESEAFVVVNNYRQNDYAPYLYHTDNYGKTWKRLVDEKDVSGYVLSFAQDPEIKNLMFLGSESGLYVSINYGKDWEKWTNAYPTVSTMDMVIQEREADLVLGTFGRSSWVIDDIRPLRYWAVEGDIFKDKNVQVFDTPDAYICSSKKAPGYYFHGDGYFKGENRRMGAMISYYVKDGMPVEEEGDETVKPDTAIIKILDSDNMVIRTLQQIPKKGINRFYWNFDKNGLKLDFGDQWSREEKYPGGGGYAIPGDYRVRINYLNDSSENSLTVHPDPRVPFDKKALVEKQIFTEQLMDEMKKFNEKVIKLNACKKSLTTIKTLAKINNNDTLNNSIKELTKKLEKFNEELNGEKEVQGIYENEDLFINKIGPLMYISYSREPFTSNQLLSINKARKVVAEMGNTIESFLNDDWMEFKTLVEKENLSLF